jgi:adenylosuccinate synthase
VTGSAAGQLSGEHVIVVDLGYGDAGKGTVVDWLCARPEPGARSPRTVVRFNGGAQAAHNVVTPDGRHHTFAQFGSGTFTPGVQTHLSRFMLVDPLALAAEAAHLAAAGVTDALDRLTVDRDALLTTPYHRAVNRAREQARGADRHGSCGMGIGETARYALGYPADAPRAGDCDAPRRLEWKLTRLRGRLIAEFGAAQAAVSAAPPVTEVCAAYQAFAGRVRLVDAAHLHRLLHAGPAVFEGAQGVLLDEWYGFHPYTTWSTTTFDNAEALLAEAGLTGTRLGVARCYLTRHGPGPLVTEDPTLELPDPHNGRNVWQGAFRVGYFDAVALRYAIEVAGGVDAVALTHLDVARRHPLRICDRYQIDGQLLDRLPASRDRDLARQERLTRRLLRARPVAAVPSGDWPAVVSAALGAPVTLLSDGPTSADKMTSIPARAA